jgi:hypothetical protein
VGDLLVRFFQGGLVVSLFAVLGDALKPRTFAGIFGAAPSVALASLILSHGAKGAPYVSTDGRSMIAGAVALFAYSAASSWAVRKDVMPPWLAALGLWTVWLGVAATLWYLFCDRVEAVADGQPGDEVDLLELADGILAAQLQESALALGERFLPELGCAELDGVGRRGFDGLHAASLLAMMWSA